MSVFVAMTRFLTVLCLVLSAQGAAAQTVEDPAHDEIRAMRDAALVAFAERDKAAFLSHLTEDVVFTAMNNEVVTGRAAGADYWDRMLVGSESLVESLDMDFAIDDLSTLYLDGNTAIAAGDVTTGFSMRAGLEFSVPLRWTAAMVRGDDGWQIAALHFSANMFDNPLDNPLRKYLWLMLAAMLVAGLGAGWLIGRRAGR